MNIASIVHCSKSNLSYAFNESTLHIRIKTGKGEVNSIVVYAVDPFNWIPSEELSGKYIFDTSSILSISMMKEYETKYHDVWFAEIKGISTLRIRYGFSLTAGSEKWFYGSNSAENILIYPEREFDVFNYFNFPYINEKDVYKAPDWVRDTIWCQLSVGCYSDDGKTCIDRESGNFEGMVKKLDYIQKMGYTGLYFTPIFQSPSFHKYDTTDYLRVDEMLGGDDSFKKFMHEAHKRGIRVMLDAVFNHCGYLHPFWQDVLKNGKKSKYFDCFYILDDSKPIIEKVNTDGSYDEPSDGKPNFRTFAFTSFMPKWNTDNLIVKEYLLNVATYWINNFNIDGWRLDVSNEVSHSFWRDFRTVVKKSNPEVYIVGENWDHAYEWLRGDQFDAVMNYGFLNPVWNYLKEPKEKESPFRANDYKDAISDLLTKYPKNIMQNMFSLVASHDLDRLLTAFDGVTEKIKLAYLLLMTFTGSPSIYYGDEVGMMGDMENNRVPMVWDEEKQNIDLKVYFKTIIKLRKEHPSFKAVDIKWIMADDVSNVIMFEKQSELESSIIIINNSDRIQIINVPNCICDIEFNELYTGQKIKFVQQLELKPYEFYILSDN